MNLHSLTGAEYFPSASLGPFWPLVCRAGGAHLPHCGSPAFWLPLGFGFQPPGGGTPFSLEVWREGGWWVFPQASSLLRHYPYSHTSTLPVCCPCYSLSSYSVSGARLSSLAPLGWGGGWVWVIVSSGCWSLVPGGSSPPLDTTQLRTPPIVCWKSGPSIQASVSFLSFIS